MSEANTMRESDEFERELQSLSAAAQQFVDERAVKRMIPSLAKTLHPLMLGIEALGRATNENTIAIKELKELKELKDAATAQRDLAGFMSGIQQKIEQKQSVNQQLFDAMHSELKGYKDGFLLETVQKPIIRDLIDLYDMFSDLDEQFASLVRAKKEPGVSIELTRFEELSTTLHHLRDTLVEILERMEVQRIEPSTGKLDKKQHRAISIVPADSINEDMMIGRSLKPGFQWRDRLVRPEEVTVKKWKEGYLMAMSEPVAQTEESKDDRENGK